jgi:hypothetical protein
MEEDCSMELFNFSADESKRIHRAMTFIAKRELDFDPLSVRTLVVNTDNFEDACQEVARYYPALGLESGNARLVFNSARDGFHKILVNKAAIEGLSYIYTLVTEFVHLGNLSRYNADHGNIYRLEAEKAIADHYYEFLLWSKFQAMKIATRVHALMAWHEVNGEAQPEDGRYQFAQADFPGEMLGATLQALRQTETLAAWREGFWYLLEELVHYFGQLAFYQQEPQPAELDEHFPAELIDDMVGLDNVLAFYGTLLRSGDYPAWLTEKSTLRRCIVVMQEKGKEQFGEEG